MGPQRSVLRTKCVNSGKTFRIVFGQEIVLKIFAFLLFLTGVEEGSDSYGAGEWITKGRDRIIGA